VNSKANSPLGEAKTNARLDKIEAENLLEFQNFNCSQNFKESKNAPEGVNQSPKSDLLNFKIRKNEFKHTP